MVADHTPVDGRLGAWLRRVREQCGWSMAYVARRSQLCSWQHLSMLELGQRRPSLALLTRLCQFYGVTPEEMVQQLPTASLSDADRDRYALFSAILPLEEDQRQHLHTLLVPLVEQAQRRKIYRSARYQQQQQEEHRTL